MKKTILVITLLFSIISFAQIRGTVKDSNGKPLPFVNIYIETLFDSLKANYGEILKIAKRVIISGGGAYVINEYLEKLPANVVFSKLPTEYSNVRGYYNG